MRRPRGGTRRDWRQACRLPISLSKGARAGIGASPLGFPSLGLSYYRLNISQIQPSGSTGAQASSRQDLGAVGTGLPVLGSFELDQFGATMGQSIGGHLVVASTLKLVHAFRTRGGPGSWRDGGAFGPCDWGCLTCAMSHRRRSDRGRSVRAAAAGACRRGGGRAVTRADRRADGRLRRGPDDGAGRRAGRAPYRRGAEAWMPAPARRARRRRGRPSRRSGTRGTVWGVRCQRVARCQGLSGWGR